MATKLLPPGVRGAFVVATLAHFLIIALVVAAKSLRDALFCDRFARADLPRAMLAGALLAGLFALAATRLFRRVGPARGSFGLLLLNAVALAVEYAVWAAAEQAMTFALYLHVSAVVAVLVSGFWLVVSERIDAHTLRHNVARIGIGGVLGGVLGGVFVDAVTVRAGARTMLLVLALLSGVAAVVILRIGRNEQQPQTTDFRQSTPGERRYLGRIGCLVGLAALASSVADFAFKARAMEDNANAAELVRFFAVFYTVVSIAGFVLQTTVAPLLLEKANLGIGLATTPAALSVTSLIALVIPGLPAQVLLKGTDASFSVSVFRLAYEPLFTPIRSRTKRSLKALVDVVVDKLGDAGGSLISWGLVAAFSVSAPTSASFVVLLASLAGIVLASKLQRSYVEELAQSLRAGTIAVDEGDVCDRTTRLTLSRTIDRMTRERLLEEIQKRAHVGSASGGASPPLPSSPGTPAPAQDATRVRETKELAKTLEALRASERKDVQSALARPNLDLVSFVIPLVERRDVGSAAMAALAAAGGRITGQLSDALLDRERNSPAIRRRLARVVAHTPTAWAAAGLLAALDDPDVDVRSEILRGLERIRKQGVALPVTRDLLFGAAKRELESNEPDARRSTDRALTLVGFAFDPDAFRLAARALASGDEKLAGTALEYLENVLPEPMRSLLLARIPLTSVTGSKRSLQELLAELLQRFGPSDSRAPVPRELAADDP